jgi:hypothetical protein
MRISDEQDKKFGYVAAVLLTLLLLFLGGIGIASAFNSSFGYAAFLQLIGNNAQIGQGVNITSQIQSPLISAASTTGTLTGGPLYVEVVATSLTGTSSPSNEYATTTSANENLQLTWPTIPGATGYAVYVSTTTPGNEQGVLYATSTSGAVNTYYSLTSTTSVIYSIPSQSGSGYLTSIGSATSTIQAPIIAAVSSATTTNCSASINGAQFYNTANSHLWLCTGAGPGWTLIK